MRKVRWLYFLGISASLLVLQVAALEPIRADLPKGCKLGMSPDDVSAVRAATRVNKYSVAGRFIPGQIEMSELTRESDLINAVWYCFRDNKLGAVTKSISTLRIPMEHTKSAAAQLKEEIRNNYFFQRRDRVLRMAGGKNVILTTELWKDKVTEHSLYFVATNQEMTLTIFDSKVFGKEDFFLELEKRDAADYSIKLASDVAGTIGDPVASVVDFLKEEQNHGAELLSHAPMAASVGKTSEGRGGLWLWFFGIVIISVGTAILLFKFRSKIRDHR